MLLIKAGLEEDEADRFLQLVVEEAVTISSQDEDGRRRFLESWLSTLPTYKGRHEPDKSRLKTAVSTILLGAAGSALWDAIKSGFEDLRSDNSQESLDLFHNGVIIEWAQKFPNGMGARIEPALRIGAERRILRYGRVHKNTLASLDGLAMSLDMQGRFREATPIRKHVLSMQEKFYGRKHPGTGAAHSNLGNCYTAQGSLQEGERHLRKGLSILTQNDLNRAAAGYNLYINVKAQGRLFGATMPSNIGSRNRTLSDAGIEMNVRKLLFLMLDPFRETMVELTESLKRLGP